MSQPEDKDQFGPKFTFNVEFFREIFRVASFDNHRITEDFLGLLEKDPIFFEEFRVLWLKIAGTPNQNKILRAIARAIFRTPQCISTHLLDRLPEIAEMLEDKSLGVADEEWLHHEILRQTNSKEIKAKKPHAHGIEIFKHVKDAQKIQDEHHHTDEPAHSLSHEFEDDDDDTPAGRVEEQMEPPQVIPLEDDDDEDP